MKKSAEAGQTSSTNDYNQEDLIPEQNLLLILDEQEFLDHIYNRYNRIFIEALIKATEIIKAAIDRDSAMDTLRHIIGSRIIKVSDNSAEIKDMYDRIFKRGNPRRKSTRGL